jgi:uncharacterized membrane protein YeaQ/YmgE (transglycosylase-associated protein family)
MDTSQLFGSHGIVWIVLIGILAGWLARLLKPGDDNMGLIWTALLGIGGSVLATVAGRQLGLYEGSRAAGFIGAVIGAIVLLVVVEQVRKRTKG